ncbi:MAG TPA: DUF4258 domain-containing protein [Chitinophagaceae bacterium]|nr:DUF4258 domain-containing protein [Chitinophagaceae bacterium]
MCDARDDDSSTKADSIKINYTCRMNAQLRKVAPIILVAILAVLLFVIRQCKHEATTGSRPTVTNKDTKKDQGTIDRDKGFDRRISYLEYSYHAKCRMDCRRILKEEVEEIMQEGKINYNKSDLQNARCPRYAVEGTTYQNQKVRIVFAQCNEKTEVVTVIDLDTEWSCNCPGDDKRFDNRN